MPESGARVFRFLFRLAAFAHTVSGEELLNRLVVGIANRYAAASCSLYLFGPARKTVSASPGPSLLRLSEPERAYLRALDGRLVEHAAMQASLVSVLDLDVDGGVHDFLEKHLPQMDIFAFPLISDEAVLGVLVLYLELGSAPLDDADVQALLGAAEVLRVAGLAKPTDTWERNALRLWDVIGADERTRPKRLAPGVSTR